MAFFITPLFESGAAADIQIWQSILTNFGTGLVSAGLILVVEPKIRRAVQTSVSNATAQAAASIKDDIRSEVQDEMHQRFATLKDQIESSVQAKLSHQDATLSGISKAFTRETALSALGTAVSMNSLNDQELIVQATNEPGELHIGLKLALPNALRNLSEFDRQESTVFEEIPHVVAYPKDSQATVEVPWKDGDDFGDVVGGLLEELQRSGGWGMAVPIDWTGVTERLAAGLRVAVESRRKQPGSFHLRGRIIEIVGLKDPWYLTDQSIECPSRDYVLPRASFNTFTVGQGFLPSPTDISGAIAPKPAFADRGEWDYLLNRGVDEFSMQIF